MDPEEIFDVVNEADIVIDQQPRRIVHRNNLLHRAVHIFLFRPDGRMLIHLRTDNKEEFPSVWTSSASGHVSAGESYERAARRELREELGISASVNYVAKFSAGPETSNEFTKLFIAESTEHVVADPEEIARTLWLQPAEIEARLSDQPDEFSPSFRLLFQYFRRIDSNSRRSKQ